MKQYEYDFNQPDDSRSLNRFFENDYMGTTWWRYDCVVLDLEDGEDYALTSDSWWIYNAMGRLDDV